MFKWCMGYWNFYLPHGKGTSNFGRRNSSKLRKDREKQHLRDGVCPGGASLKDVCGYGFDSLYSMPVMELTLRGTMPSEGDTWRIIPVSK